MMSVTFEASIDTRNESLSIEQEKEMLQFARLALMPPQSKDQMALDAAVRAGMSSFDLATRNFPHLFLVASAY